MFDIVFRNFVDEVGAETVGHHGEGGAGESVVYFVGAFFNGDDAVLLGRFSQVNKKFKNFLFVGQLLSAENNFAQDGKAFQLFHRKSIKQGSGGAGENNQVCGRVNQGVRVGAFEIHTDSDRSQTGGNSDDC